MVDVAGSIGGVVSPLLQVGEWLAAPIWRQFKYVFNYRGNFNSLQEQVDKLKNTRDEVQHKVTAAKRNVEEIKQNVKSWQAVVEKTITKAEQLIQQNENNPRCFKGLCPNFIIYHKQSKKAFKLKRDDIDPLLQHERELDPVSNPSNPPEIWLRTSEDYLTFESRNSTMKNVWDALNDENVFMIGVYGMGGLGKTTLVQEIGRKAEKEKLFEEIVFVEVSESPDIKKIQTKIADKLKLKFENESEMANKLYSRMENKNILLILDNIWKPIELDKMVGIPCGVDRGRNKLLFTTRTVGVLKSMGSTNNFGIGFLNDDEAWTLFTKMAGNVIQERKLGTLPNEVCKECKGLPIVICTIAKALKDKSDLYDWKVALQELRAPISTKFTGDLEEDYMKIALSYKFLRDELKKTFLISSLLENNTSISDLFKHVVCLGILEGANLTMEEARDRLDKLVRDLNDACLLLGDLRSKTFAMHDVVRTVAITTAYVEHHVFTARNDIEREWNDRDTLKKCTKISLPGNSPIISQLWPDDFDCQNLEYFYVTNMRESSFKFRKDIFKAMSKLRVMNLVGLQQSSLLSSIHLLTNLQSLCLDYSNVEDFSIIGKLKTLKVLSLQYSTITEFPIEFGQLIQLRLLDLSECWKLEVVAPNVISQLSQLEEFYVKGCPIKWKHEELEKVKLLSKLTNLELDITDNNVLPEDFLSKELKRYKISIGASSFFLANSQRTLHFKFNSTICLEKLHGIKNVEVLQLDESSVEKNNTKASQVILQSNETRPLFNKKVIFTNLMSLELLNISFGMIWESQLSTSSYENLTMLFLDHCNKIKYVFPFFVAKVLQQLQHLHINDCQVLEKIVEEEEEGTEVVSSVFPHIIRLVLQNLPKLTVFYQGAHALKLLMLKDLKICNCPNFTSRYQNLQDNNEEGEVQVLEPKSIYLGNKINSDLVVITLKDDWKGETRHIYWRGESRTLVISQANISIGFLQRFYNLKVLRVTNSSLEPKLMSKVIFTDLMSLELVNISFGIIWESQLSTSSYENLTKLILDQCNKIKYVFPFFVAKSLQQLQDLHIRYCQVLEKIVEKEEEGIEVVNSVFPSIIRLVFQNLPKLTVFYQGAHALKLPMLKDLEISNCPNFTSRYQDLQDNNEEGEVQVLESKSICLDHKINSDLEVIRLRDYWKGKTRHIYWWGESRTLDISQANISIGFLQGFYNLKALRVTNSSLEPKLMSKVIFTNLMSLQLVNISFGKIWESQLSTSSYENLTRLVLEQCNKIKYVFPFFVAKSLRQLQYLSIQKCEVLEKIVEEEEEEEGIEVVNYIFPHITTLTLEDLPKLTVFYHEAHVLELPKLKNLYICNCLNFTSRYQDLQDKNEEGEVQVSESKSTCLEHKVVLTNLMTLELDKISFEMIWESQLSASSYENLTKLILDRCNKIKYVFPFFVAKSLKQLQYFQIRGCMVLEKIVEKEEEEEGTEVVNSIFPHIIELVLHDLPKLTVFYQGAHALDLSLLKELKIVRCPNFTSRYECFQDNNEKGEIQVSESKSICLEHKINSNLGQIQLVEDMWNNSKMIRWSSESKTLKISNMNISIGLVQRFYNLEVLCIDSDYKLMSLLLFSVYFQNLKVLEIIDCFGLIKRLITPSTTKSLVQLREMKIVGCIMLFEIVENEGDEMTTEIVFNNLNKLSLLELDNLTCFYSGNYSFNFPSLKELIIEDCPNMKTFSSGSLNTPKLCNVLYEEEPIMIGENDLNTIIQEASKKRVNSDLKKLTLSGRDIMSIWQGEFEENFDKVETLELIKDEHSYIPIHIFTKFVSLKQLELTVSSYEEIFSCEEGEEHVRALTQLNVLQLWGLFNLKCIWKQDFQFKSILQNLYELSVVFCHNLMTLLPRSSSFKNLTTLQVAYCNGLQDLIASSTTKSLVCLEKLKIKECEMMIEVLANEGDKEEDEIVFEKLKKLTLVKLKSLTCFYSRNCALNFPFLESLNVSECFKMKTFSGEGLDMPRLQKVNKKVCTNDLDSIIQQLQNDCSEFCNRMAKEFKEEEEEEERKSNDCSKFCDRMKREFKEENEGE